MSRTGQIFAWFYLVFRLEQGFDSAGQQGGKGFIGGRRHREGPGTLKSFLARVCEHEAMFSSMMYCRFSKSAVTGWL